MNPHEDGWTRRRCLGSGAAWLAAMALPGCGGRLSDNAFLESLAVSSGTLVPAFSEGFFNYTVTVGNAVSSVNFTPRSSDDAARVRVQGSRVDDGDASPDYALSVGSNLFEIVVTAEDGDAQRTYTVTVVRAAATSSDAALYALLVSAGTLSPAFSASVTRYAVTVAQDVASIRFTPVSGNSPRSITIEGTVVTDSTLSSPVSLMNGSNDIEIVVVSQDGSTSRTYAVNVTRNA